MAFNERSVNCTGQKQSINHTLSGTGLPRGPILSLLLYTSSAKELVKGACFHLALKCAAVVRGRQAAERLVHAWLYQTDYPLTEHLPKPLPQRKRSSWGESGSPRGRRLPELSRDGLLHEDCRLAAPLACLMVL